MRLIIPFGKKYGTSREDGIALIAMYASRCVDAFPDDCVILEIGALVGKSTIAMASVSGHKIVSIDPHDGPWVRTNHKTLKRVDRRERIGSTYETFMENIREFGVAHKIECIKDFSNNVEWDGRKICLLFIDGNHDKEWVLHDFNKFREHLVDGAYVIFHDYGSEVNAEVKPAVDSLVASGVLDKHIELVEEVIVFRYRSK